MRGRVPVARRSILADGRRLVTGVFGLGAAIALILLLQGMWSGVQVQVASYDQNSGVQLFVGDRDARSTSDSSTVSPEALRKIRTMSDVQAADPILLHWNILTLHDKRIFTEVVGFDPGRLGGPWNIAAGRTVLRDDEIVVDQLLARQHGVRVGSTIEVTARRFNVVGLSTGTRTWMSAYVFITRRAAAELAQAGDTSTFVLVRTREPAAVASQISKLGLTPLTIPEIVRNDRKIFGVLKGPFSLMVLIAFVAGTLIVALTVYSQVVERVREYGIVKAMGARAGRLFGIVLGQTLVLGGLGVGVGLLLFAAGSRLLSLWRPQFWIRLSASQIVFVIAAAVLMALLASIIPTRRVARLDPATVYRG